MPTTEPLDQGDDAEGQLKPIAQFAQPAPPQPPAPPRHAPAPAPQPAQQPARQAVTPTPAAATHHIPQPATNARAYKGLGGPTIRLNSHPQAAQATTTATHAPSLNRQTPFTDADLENAWNAFIAQHPTEHILVNTMRASHPVKTDHGYRITVENDTQVMTMHENMPRIKQYLGDALSNDTLTFEIASNAGESSPLTWNDREVFKHMADTYPEFADFVKTLSLQL